MKDVQLVHAAAESVSSRERRNSGDKHDPIIRHSGSVIAEDHVLTETLSVNNGGSAAGTHPRAGPDL